MIFAVDKMVYSIESIYSRKDKGLVCPFLSSVNNKAPDKSYG